MLDRAEHIGNNHYSTYKYYDIIDYENCCVCPYFSDNWREERLECLKRDCHKLCKNEGGSDTECNDNCKNNTDCDFTDFLFLLTNIVKCCNDGDCYSQSIDNYGKNKDLIISIGKDNFDEAFIKTTKDSKLVDEVHNVNVKDKSLVSELWRIYNYGNFEIRIDKLEKARRKIEEYLLEDYENMHCIIYGDSIDVYCSEDLEFCIIYDKPCKKWYISGELDLDQAVNIKKILSEINFN
mgnify:CR=1 FL=1